MGNNIGNRIKEIRKKYGITQKQLADAIGYSSQQSIAHLENSDKAPRHEIVELIAKALGVSVSDIYSDIPIFLIRNHEFEEKYRDEQMKQLNERHIQHYLIENSLKQLNDKGLAEAAKRLKELTLVPEYTSKD